MQANMAVLAAIQLQSEFVSAARFLSQRGSAFFFDDSPVLELSSAAGVVFVLDDSPVSEVELAAGLVFFFDEWHRRGRPRLPLIGRLTNDDHFEPLLDETGLVSEAPDDSEYFLEAAVRPMSVTQDAASQPSRYVFLSLLCIC
jgi:hypothetical protein